AAPRFAYNAAVTHAGVSVAGDGISLDLVAAGVPTTTLPAGRYWLVVFPSMIGNASALSTSDPFWAWRYSPALRTGNVVKTITPSTDSAWRNEGNDALAATVAGRVDCTQPNWISYDITSGALRLNGQSNVTALFDSTG